MADSVFEKSTRIRKNDANLISEAHDNFRKPKPANDEELSILNAPQIRSGSP
jgi:hypothetical protein